MKNITKLVSSAILGAAILFAAPASAQKEEQIDPAAAAAAMRYVLPLAFEGYMTACFETLDEDGFVISNAPALREKFTNGAEASWPGAREFLMQVARERGGFDGSFDGIEDDELRQEIDDKLAEVLAAEMKPETCTDIERALEILDPLPADNMAAMIGFLVDLVVNEDEARSGPMDLSEFETDYPEDEPEMTESRARKLREQEEAEAAAEGDK